MKFLDETETVKAEAAKLKADGIDIIIVLSHSGLDVDQIIAANCGPDIDVIVGGHTHTFLFTGSNSPGPDTPRGDYPTIVTQADGHQVYVVQASAYTKYLGDITFWFDDAGKIVRHEGAPIFLDDSVQPGNRRLTMPAVGRLSINHRRVALDTSHFLELLKFKSLLVVVHKSPTRSFCFGGLSQLPMMDIDW